MFTPPSSPPPPRQPGDPAPVFPLHHDTKPPCGDEPPIAPKDDVDHDHDDHQHDRQRKRAWGRRMTAGVIALPLLLVLVTATTQFCTHPAILDLFSASSSPLRPGADEERTWRTTVAELVRPHKRHPHPADGWVGGEPTTTTSPIQFPTGGTSVESVVTPTGSAATQFPTGPVTVVTSTVIASATTTAGASRTSQALPTVPSGAVNVPTPFPQPFDTALQQNFSSVSCYNFFLNMTNSISFRSCRPFSLLLQSSQAFINAQTNITLLNEVVWGMCNTQLTQSQCVANMAWFASSLRSTCQDDLNNRNAMASTTLTALLAFTLMQQTGCLIDPSTNTYCYVEAAYNPNPSDQYFYQLPLGMPLPNNTRSTCSGCTRTMMALFSAALRDSSQAANLHALQTTYPSAATLANSVCGSGYAPSSTKSSSPVAVPRPHPLVWTGAALLALVCGSWWIP